ncbi:MAG: D-aminoacyl-tRNA deacylase [Actinomycetota bacterium]|jgi:D-tyrosyl-tRNA(Tyr) deacylase|nr:D-aminoacyl-tRNA deacylase [Actinomycetota bacterium]
MRALVQRVTRAGVTVDGDQVSSIGPGMLVLLGVRKGDAGAEAEKIASRLLKLRIFEDADGRMNDPVGDREILCVSQFTLYGDTRKGNRPGWSEAAGGEEAEPLYDLVCERLGAKKGIFGADMEVDLVNDGPVTLLLET